MVQLQKVRHILNNLLLVVQIQLRNRVSLQVELLQVAQAFQIPERRIVIQTVV